MAAIKPSIPLNAWGNDALFKNIAPIYNSDEHYEIGDLVLSPFGALVSAVEETSGEYNLDKWEEVKISQFLHQGGGLSFVEGEGLNITWDGDTTGKDTITLWDEYVFYKVSDTVLSPKDINGSIVTYDDGDIRDDRTAFAVAPDETALLYGNGESIEVVSGTEGEHTLRDEYGDEAQIVLPSSGTYFLFDEQYNYYVASLAKQGSPKLVQDGVDVTEQIADLIAQYLPSAG